MKESGAAFRKQRKAREAIMKKHKGALLKYINHQKTATNIDQTSTKTAKVCESKPLSHSIDSAPNILSTISDHSDVEHKLHEEKNIPYADRVDFKDVGLWPSKINNDIRVLLVR